MSERAASGPAPDYSARADRLIERLRPEDAEQLLVTSLVNVSWLTGFTGTNGACLAGPDRRLFLTDFRYAERAAGITGWEVEIVSGEWLKGVASLLSGTVGLEDDRITLREADRLREMAGEDSRLIPSGGLVEDLRRVKEPAELGAIAAAAQLTDSIYLEVIEAGLTGRSEAEVSAFVVGRMREEGAEPSFPPIVASGPNGASPHAEPGPREIGRGELVTIDMGSRLDGYCSDCTRTFATGTEADLDDTSREIYEVTLAANLKGLDALGPGIAGSDVDAEARGVIADAGYGDRFGHGLGHGVGLEVHEAPRLGPRSEDELRVGEVVTVEPGIYLPGRTGVRIEDMVTVGREGVGRNFSSISKDLTFVS
ncbi:MAG: aminopeptidase P family protein [Actinomycetota bacterium]|nr:aminopeptidase P family protein [Actinomycetota bacterium]